MENCEQAYEEELPTFSLRMEFLTTQKERKVKENKEQARPSFGRETLRKNQPNNKLVRWNIQR